MKLEFVLEEQDFLNLHLFSISENKIAKRIGSIGKYIAALVFVYIGVNLYNSDRINFAYICFAFAVLSILFFNKYYKNRLKKLQRTVVKKTYQQRFGDIESIEFFSDYFISKSKIGEGKIKMSEILYVDEIATNFFIRLSNGSSYIISKKELTNSNEIKSTFKESNIEVKEYLSWKW